MLPDLVAWMCGSLLLVLLAATRFRASFDIVLAAGLVLGGAVNSVIALLQYFDLEDGVGLLVAIASPTEAFGNLQQRNLLATLLACSLVSLNHLRRAAHIGRALSLGTAFLLTAALAATTSRTGFVHMVILLVCALFWRFDVRRAMGLMALYLMLSVLLPISMRWFTGLDSSPDLLLRLQSNYQCASRWVIWANMLELIGLKPWTGWGSGGLVYAHYITEYESARACMKLSNAHNIVLQWAVAWGVPAALALSIASVGILWKLAPWKATSDGERFAWLVLALIGFHSLVEFPLWFGWFQVLTICAMLLVLFSDRSSGPPVSLFQAARALKEWPMRWATLGLASLVVLLTIGYDYFKVSQLYLPVSLRPEYYKIETLSRTKDTWLFKTHVLIAQVVSTPVTEENAGLMLIASQEAIRIAPDSRIIRQLLLAAEVTGRRDLFAVHSARYRASWPAEYAEWSRLRASSRQE